MSSFEKRTPTEEVEDSWAASLIARSLAMPSREVGSGSGVALDFSCSFDWAFFSSGWHDDKLAIKGRRMMIFFMIRSEAQLVKKGDR